MGRYVSQMAVLYVRPAPACGSLLADSTGSRYPEYREIVQRV